MFRHLLRQIVDMESMKSEQNGGTDAKKGMVN
jgi:hypothetical protein